MKTGLRIAVADRETEPTAGKGGRACEIGARVTGRTRLQRAHGGLCLVEPAGSEVHIGQHGEQRGHRRTTGVEFAQGPLEGVLRQRCVASRQLGDSTGTSGVEVALETVEQLLGLLVAALPGA